MSKAYNAAIGLYRSAARLAALGSPKVRHMLHGQAETLDRLRKFRSEKAPDGFDVWFHAASLGEFEQARPLIDALLQHSPKCKILLSFFSPSGYEVRCDYDPRVAVVYMPFDLPSNVNAFLDAASPKMAVFVKYEFWGNYLFTLAERGIPTYIISAIFRPGQIFFKPWGSLFRDMLRTFAHLYVQDERSRDLLAEIGVDNVTVAGDTRFDRVTAIRASGREIKEIACFRDACPGALTLVVGSSWERDEDVYVPWLRKHPECRAVIAPHEFDKDRLSAMRRRLGTDHTMLFTDFRRIYEASPEGAAKVAKSLRYLIMDCFGLLSSAYRYADITYVGGGFGAGIHNINEAAVYGVPVVFGPKHSKFNEARELIACGGAFSIKSQAEAAEVLTSMATDAKARKAAGSAAGHYIATKIGATPIIAKDLFNISLK
ncbi:MAG: 3-deoxy-D-manno-octulosonic acid transferase [Muribaculaceae bacterium]|nr:3-deoxy-D-manno-octulosonic acid transferase [Muribaculaceae bacterium]